MGSTKPRARYALLGAGARAETYVRGIAGPHRADAELVAVGDVNPGRIAHYIAVAREYDAELAPFAPDDLEVVIAERSVDVVIVASPDDTHAAYVSRALRAGADVIVEKPVTTDAAGCRVIAETATQTGRRVTATFNYRYAPRNAALKELIASGAVGEITSVHFEWLLDTVHGADYFRRWHREKQHSGGLLVHKASHHFDLVNWWLNDAPRRVYASGGLRFYGADNARRRGLDVRPERGSTGPSRLADPFVLDMRTVPGLEELYLRNEHHDGYVRDRDVFVPGITIEDNLAVVVDYERGATLSYALNAHSPWEGYTVSVNGTLGRAELQVVERAAVSSPAVVDPSYVDERRATPERAEGARLLVQRHWGEAEAILIEDATGNHGGADPRMLDDLFSPSRQPDPLGRRASLVDGIRAAGVGIAGNLSMSRGAPVLIADLDLLGSASEDRR